MGAHLLRQSPCMYLTNCSLAPNLPGLSVFGPDLCSHDPGILGSIALLQNLARNSREQFLYLAWLISTALLAASILKIEDDLCHC